MKRVLLGLGVAAAIASFTWSCPPCAATPAQPLIRTISDAIAMTGAALLASMVPFLPGWGSTGCGVVVKVRMPRRGRIRDATPNRVR